MLKERDRFDAGVEFHFAGQSGIWLAFRLLRVVLESVAAFGAFVFHRDSLRTVQRIPTSEHLFQSIIRAIHRAAT